MIILICLLISSILDAVKKNEQPIGGVIQKSIVPVTFVLSSILLFWAARNGGRIAAYIVAAYGLGWLALIIYFGLV